MNHSHILMLIFVLVIAAGANPLEEKDEFESSKWMSVRTNSKHDELDYNFIEIVENIEDYKTANPSIDPIEMTQEIVQGPPGTGYHLVYHLGVKQGAIIWNSKVALKGEQNYQHEITYDGDSKVSYVEVQVDQTSLKGRFYVVDGGLGQNYLRIVVEASNTRYFGINADFYG